MPLLQKMMDFVRGLVGFGRLQEWQEECVGKQVEDFGVIQERRAAGGILRHDLHGFLAERRGVLVLFLNMAGVSRADAYPLESEGRARLRDILAANEEGFAGPFAEHVEVAGRRDAIGWPGRLRRWVAELGPGRIIRDFGVIEEVAFSSDVFEQFRYQQSTRVYATVKGGQLFLILHIDYRMPGRSGFETYPLDEAGRHRLRNLLVRIEERERPADTGIATQGRVDE